MFPVRIRLSLILFYAYILRECVCDENGLAEEVSLRMHIY